MVLPAALRRSGSISRRSTGRGSRDRERGGGGQVRLAYEPAMQCPVLTYRMVLASFAMPSTDIGATTAVCIVRY